MTTHTITEEINALKASITLIEKKLKQEKFILFESEKVALNNSILAHKSTISRLIKEEARKGQQTSLV